MPSNDPGRTIVALLQRGEEQGAGWYERRPRFTRDIRYRTVLPVLDRHATPSRL
jgi:hypothetical protein